MPTFCFLRLAFFQICSSCDADLRTPSGNRLVWSEGLPRPWKKIWFTMQQQGPIAIKDLIASSWPSHKKEMIMAEDNLLAEK